MVWMIALGSALGGAARFILGTLIQQRAGVHFPVGTLLINVSGSLLLGFLLRYGLDTPGMSPEVRAFCTIGFCGGYTTFSSFSYETMALLEEGQVSRAMAYIGLSVVLSLAGAYLGLIGARYLVAFRGRV
jgi:CrcB protein